MRPNPDQFSGTTPQSVPAEEPSKKGSDGPDRHRNGPLESPNRSSPEHEGATEDQVSETMPPAGSAFNDEPKQG